MTDAQIRKIVQEELRKANNSSRFKVNSIPQHVHNGVDSPQVSSDNIKRTPIIIGSIEFAQQTTYTLNLNATFTPTKVTAYTAATGPSSTRVLSVGSAYLTTAFYLQPLSGTSVQTGNLEYPFDYPAQTSSCITVEGASGSPRALTSEFAICSIPYNGATINAQMKVKNFSRSFITVEVTVLEAGWTLFPTFIIE